MAYTTINFKTKKALKEAVAAGQSVTVFQPNDITGRGIDPDAKGVHIEGPHYPKPHSWYAMVDLDNGRVVKVR